jgi:ATP-dependent RNA helicase DeaD
VTTSATSRHPRPNRPRDGVSTRKRRAGSWHPRADACGAARRGNLTRLFIGAGRRRRDASGRSGRAITGEAGLTSREIGAIEIADAFSLVEVPDDRADAIIAALRKTKLRGLKPAVRRE